MTACKVHIEFQRVQTWLFSVPRLRAMVGANALLGEELRVRLPELARKPDLARRSGAKWSLAPMPEADALGFGGIDAIDPLGAGDNPAADAKEGILARDGGHFEALFSSGADDFAQEASERIRRELPGLRFAVTVGDKRLEQTTSGLSTELPVLAPCEWTGRGLASVKVHQGDEKAAVSLEVHRRHEAALRASEGKAKDGAADKDKAQDLASLLTRETLLATKQLPGTFDDLAAGEYLAVIHADGNGVGLATQGKSDPEKARFFHRNRVLLRGALKEAMERAGSVSDETIAPLTVLMLGGDDVLVVCRASLALRFVKDLCEKLQDLQRLDPKDQFRLTLGIGVVFARPSVPFHRLHAVAEQLASSAKRKYRGLDRAVPASVVDWAVYTTAWADDPAEVRARDWIRGKKENQRVLSQRPLLVLGDGLDCLNGLLDGADKLNDAPRSQLHYLVEQLGRGKTLAELAFEELSDPTGDALKAAGVRSIWIPTKEGEPLLTSVLDLVEVCEIPKLGRFKKVTAPTTPVWQEDRADGMEAVHGEAK